MTVVADESAGSWNVVRRREAPDRFSAQCTNRREKNVLEAAGVEIYRDVNETERLLYDQELGVLVDPTVSGVIG